MLMLQFKALDFKTFFTAKDPTKQLRSKEPDVVYVTYPKVFGVFFAYYPQTDSVRNRAG